MLVGEVEVWPVWDDAGLGLQGDLRPLGRRELHRLGEALLTLVQARAVHVGVVEEIDARIARRRDQGTDLVVALVRDAHQAEDDVGGGQPARADGNDLHGRGTFRGGEGEVRSGFSGQQGQLVGGELQVCGTHGVADALRAGGAVNRDDDRRQRELPGQRDLLGDSPRGRRRLAGTRCAETRCRRPGRCRRAVTTAGTRSPAPRMLELVETGAEPWGELVLHRDQAAVEDVVGLVDMRVSAFEMPASWTTPSSSRSRIAPMESAYGTFGSGRWNW